MKFVAVDNAAPVMPCDTIVLDNRKAAELAVSHIIAMGHRKIGVIAGFPHQFVSQQRLAGYFAALESAGLKPDPSLIRRGDFRIEEASRACSALIALPDRPSALFVANNLMLIGVMKTLAEKGLSVPADMSVVSIDDFPWSTAFQPALTVIRQPVTAMAAAAFKCLTARIMESERPLVRDTLPPELIVRGSCAAMAN
jgi:LacI family transcriptional regulator